MKAISVREPWAELIAKGEKTIETRAWKTKHRGPILIVASLKPRTENSGKAIAVAEIAFCRKMTIADEQRACCDIYSRAISWRLKNIKRIDPFKVKGKLGVYNVKVPENRECPECGGIMYLGEKENEHTQWLACYFCSFDGLK